MNKRKMVPIIIAVILLLVAVFLFFYNKSKKNLGYTKLIINYNNETKEYKDLNELKTFDINQSFIVGSVEKTRMIVLAPVDVTVNNKTVKANNEIEIIGGNSYNVCFSSNDCFKIELSR